MNTKLFSTRRETMSAPARQIESDAVRRMVSEDDSLSDILEIVRISQDTQDTARHLEERNRRIISSHDSYEVNIVRY